MTKLDAFVRITSTVRLETGCVQSDKEFSDVREF